MDKYLTKNLTETQEVGFNLAQEILKDGPQKSATVLSLKGDLGAGKTTFLQGFAKALGVVDVVNSPTFVIMKNFPLPSGNFSHFYHLDLYRLENAGDLDFLNLPEILENPKNIVAIEWPERLGEDAKNFQWLVEILHLGADQREITIAKNQ